MQLQLQNFATLVSNAAASVQGSARQLIDLTVGSTLRAILEANAAIALWIQWLIVQVLATTRAATSNGSDLDSWVADFSMQRLVASPAAGQVIFNRFTPTQPAFIPAGTAVRTSDGSQTFTVSINSGNSAWSGSLGGYVLGAGIASISLPAVASSSGSSGNVQAGSISLLASALPGIDAVTNSAPFAGGIDAETDTALRQRFTSYLASRARATPLSIGQAILSVRQGLNYTLQENIAPDGSSRIGSFMVTVDDGSGAPSSTLLNQVAAAVETTRPIGSMYAIQAPAVVPVSVSMSIITAPGSVHGNVAANVTIAITAAINAMSIGASLPWSRLAQLAYDADPNVINVSNIILNGGPADVIPSQSGLIKAGLVQVN